MTNFVIHVANLYICIYFYADTHFGGKVFCPSTPFLFSTTPVLEVLSQWRYFLSLCSVFLYVVSEWPFCKVLRKIVIRFMSLYVERISQFKERLKERELFNLREKKRAQMYNWIIILCALRVHPFVHVCSVYCQNACLFSLHFQKYLI